MRFLKPVRWKEGLFLRPHHLQQFDLYTESRESARLATHESHGWGLARLEVDDESLTNFQLSVTALRAVLPNGTLVDVPANASLPKRPFQESMLQAGKPLEVAIGLRSSDDQRPHVSPTGAEDGESRFVGTELEVPDLDAGRDPTPIEFLRYNLRFFFGDEPTHGYDVLPILRLARTGDTARPVRVDSGFAPPALQLRGSAMLHDVARAVVERLALVLREHGQKRGSSDADPLILYQALAGCLPVLKDMVHDGQVHPRHVYREMARLAGALFYRDKQGRSPDIVPPYDHRAPGPVFERLRELILELSAYVIEERYRRIPLERSGDEFASALPDDCRKPGIRLFLELVSGDPVAKLKTLVLAAKISNPTRISTLRDFALPGVPTEPLAGAPHELGPNPAGTYFRLKTEHEEWSTHVVPSGQFMLFLLGAPADMKINLIVVFPG